MRTEPAPLRHPARSSLFWDNVRMALGSMLSTKLRSFLTLLGLMIGVGTVIAMMAVIAGLNASVTRQIASLGSGVLYISKYEAGIQFGGGERRKPRKDLLFEDGQAIAGFCPAVAAVSEEIGDGGYVSSGKVKTSFINITGVTASFVDVNDWSPEEGRFLINDDLTHRNHVCVLGQGPAGILFPNGGAIGQWIELEGLKYQVVGVMTGRGKFLGQSMDDVVLIPLTVLARLRDYGDRVDYMTVRPRSATQVDEAKDEITELLRRRRGVKANAPDDFGITSQALLMDLYKRLTGALYLVTILLSSIGLMVGGIGVMNMMLVSVKERTREIGVRSALGARRRDILGQFLTEAVTLTLAGGLCGIALGYSLAGIISLSFHVPLAVTLPGIAVALGISAGVGIFFGWYPAFRASRLDPVEALRYE
jgi:putative ABC transport system permease protein